MNEFPWSETAALVSQLRNKISGEMERVVLAEGTLGMVAAIAGRMTRDERRSLKISLPDRQVKPFEYQGPSMQLLIDAMQARMETVLAK